ncbi:MAG: helix-turn-helix domain-containing protein [Candidatus Giovannonibacteria bacterium]|nr:helix-turn-helix domain-containing protein [Candidatus Giovannonibacteria bacterium]
MANIEKSLEYVGLKPKEARIYLALLELGEASVVQLAKKAGIKRTTVYNILPDFINRGIVTSTVKKKRKVYFVEDPRSLKNGIKEKENVIDKLMPELLAIQNIIPLKPRITFYEGVGGMKNLYEDTLESCKEGDIIFSYTGLSDFSKLVPQEYADYYIQERVRRKIRIRIIASNSPAARSWKNTAVQDLREIRIVKDSPFQFNADMEIYANKIAIISYRENFMGVIIESKEINQMQRAAFELMWNSLDK